MSEVEIPLALHVAKSLRERVTQELGAAVATRRLKVRESGDTTEYVGPSHTAVVSRDGFTLASIGDSVVTAELAGTTLHHHTESWQPPDQGDSQARSWKSYAAIPETLTLLGEIIGKKIV